MLKQMLHTRSSKREDERMHEVEAIKAKLREFGETAANPVRDQITDLRALRASGRLTEADYAVTVAALLGAVDATTDYPRGTSLDERFRAA